MQKNGAFILITCLVLLTAFFSRTVTTAMPPSQASDVAFKTPEEAITSYLEGVTQGDLGKIMQASAIGEMSEHFNFDVYIERLQYLGFQAPSPTSYPFYVELNKAQFSYQISTQVKIFAYSLLFSEELGEAMTIKMDAEKVNNFLKSVDPARLAHIEVKKIDLPNKTRMNSTRYLETASKIASSYGADESTERVALFSFEQNYYAIGFSLLRYGENWKVSSQASPMSNISASGGPKKTTVEEFESLINGN